MNLKKIIFCSAFTIFSLNAMTEQERLQYLKNVDLEDAIQGNSMEAVKKALEEGASPNTFVRHQYNRSQPLRNAIRKPEPNLEIIKLLLGYNANVNETEHNITPSLLYEATSLGHYDAAKLFVARGADVNYIFEGDSVLFASMMNPDFNFVKLLLDKGSNVDLVCKNKNNPTIPDFSILDMTLVGLNLAQAIREENFDAIKEEFKKHGHEEIRELSQLTVDRGKNLRNIEELKKIAPLLIAYGAAITLKEYDHEFLKPLLKPYVEAITKNSPLFNPLARLVIEYIYNIKVDV